MRIKVAVLCKDTQYKNRIAAVFNNKFQERLETYLFGDENLCLQSLRDSRIDIFLAEEIFEIDLTAIPEKCGFAYLTEVPDAGNLRGAVTICKYQKAELIYKEILGIFSEKASCITGARTDESATPVLAFTSPAGGCGTSVAAAGCAGYLAKHGKKVLMLDLTVYGDTSVFFSGEGTFDFSDIIYAIKSKKANLRMKLESCVKRDANGVYYYESSRSALDMLECTEDEISQLIYEIRTSDLYDYIVIDYDFGMREIPLTIMQMATAVVFVSDGADITNRKIVKGVQMLEVMERNLDISYTRKLSVLYNRYSSRSGRVLEFTNIRTLGGAPVFAGAAPGEAAEQLAQMQIFGEIQQGLL